MRMRDGYAVGAEYLELFSLPMWAGLRPRLVDALDGADPSAGPLLDLGAGTGIGTQVVLGALPAARVLAVEPSPALRAVLLAKLAADPDGARRVTVQPADAAGAELPDRLGGVIAMHMIGHLDPAARRALWGRLVGRLAPGAPLVVGLQPPAEAVAVPFARHSRAEIGDLTYEGWASAEPTGASTIRWTMTYRTLHRGRLLGERTAEHDWHILPAAAAVAELTDAGLHARTAPGGLVVATREAA